MENTVTTQTPITFAADPEHGALRISIVFIFVFIWAVVFALLNTIIPSEGINILALIVSFVATALLTQQVERQLKERWPSGRTVQIDHGHVRIVKKSQVQHQVDASQRVNVMLWRFRISRRSRVPKGWYMVACALEQDSDYIPVYTFMSPTQFDALNASQHFTILQSKKEAQKEGPGDMRLAGEQRRLHAAESVRWMDGAEVSADDFQQFIRHLQERFPQWMPSVV
jgi:hypothetical protein